MKNFMILVIVMVFLAGCATSPGTKPIEVYTFKKDRVDQNISGNQGYLEGDAPAATGPRKTKRTLIGIDVEVPGSVLPESGSSSSTSSSGTQTTKDTSKTTQTQVQQTTTVVEEEQWIK